MSPDAICSNIFMSSVLVTLGIQRHTQLRVNVHDTLSSRPADAGEPDARAEACRQGVPPAASAAAWPDRAENPVKWRGELMKLRSASAGVKTRPPAEHAAMAVAILWLLLPCVLAATSGLIVISLFVVAPLIVA